MAISPGPTAVSPPSPPSKPRPMTKKYRCSYCDRAFSRSEHRTRHERSHTKERPFHCPKCPSTFVRRDLLLRHDRTVHAQKTVRSEPAQIAPAPPSPNTDSPFHTLRLPPMPMDGMSTLATAAATSATARAAPDPEFNAALLMTELHGSSKGRDSGLNTPNTANHSPRTSNLPSTAHQSPNISNLIQHPKHEWDDHHRPDGPIHRTTSDGHHTSYHRISSDSHPSYHRTSTDSHTSQSSRTTELTVPDHCSSLVPHFEGSTLPLMKYLPSHDHHPPTKLQINRYLSSYFNFFHSYLPLLHAPTFDPHAVAPSLVFSVCAIGALLCNELNMATQFHTSSKLLISDINMDYARNTPIWATQAVILNLVYAAWTGDPRGLEHINATRTLLANLVNTAVYDTCLKEPEKTFRGWLEKEMVKRAYFAVFVVSGTLTAVFNYPCGFSNHEVPEALELPCSELLWSLSSHHLEQESERLLTFSQSLSHLMSGGQVEDMRLSSFAVRILSTALFIDADHQARVNDYRARDRLLSAIEMWDLASRDPHPRTTESADHVTTSSGLLALIPIEETSSLLSKIRAQQHPLIVTGSVLSLVSQIRLRIDLTSVLETIRYHVPHDICHASLQVLGMLINTGRLKSPEVTTLVSQCFDVFRLPCIVGLRALKTMIASPAVTASIENLLYGFEISLVVIMWLHRFEQDRVHGVVDGEELLVYGTIERMCCECGLEKIHGQLAPALAIFAADVLEGVECWGLAGVLSLSLRSFGYSLFPSSPSNGSRKPSRSSSILSSLPPPPSLNPLMSNIRTTEIKPAGPARHDRNEMYVGAFKSAQL